MLLCINLFCSVQVCPALFCVVLNSFFLCCFLEFCAPSCSVLPSVQYTGLWCYSIVFLCSEQCRAEVYCVLLVYMVLFTVFSALYSVNHLFVVLCFKLLCCAALYVVLIMDKVLCCAALHSVLFCSLLCCVAFCSVARKSIGVLLLSMMFFQRSLVLCCFLWCCAAWYSVMPLSKVLCCLI